MWSLETPRLAEQLAERLRAEEVALDLVLEVLLPVEPDRPGNVRLGVEGGVLVHLHDPDRAVVEVVLDPLGVDQHVLRVLGHGSLLRSPGNRMGITTIDSSRQSGAPGWTVGHSQPRFAAPTLHRVTRIAEEPASAPQHGYLPAAYDEAFEADGTPRAPYAELIEALEGTDLRALGRRVAAHLRDQDVTFGAGEDGAFSVDPIPRVIDRRGVGAASTAAWRSGPGRSPRSSPTSTATGRSSRRAAARPGDRVRRPLRALDDGRRRARRRGYVAGLDLVRGADGVLRVLEDNIRTPSGLAYALAARECLDAPPARARPAGTARPVPGAATRSAPRCARRRRTASDDPTVVLLSDGPREQRLVRAPVAGRARLDIPLVTPADLPRATGRLYAELGRRAREPVDVVYRRTDEDRLRDDAGRADLARRLPARAGAPRHASRGQPVRLRSGRRQARARLRRGDGPLLPRRGAAAAVGAPPTTSASPTCARRCCRDSTSSWSSRAAGWAARAS